MVVTNRFTTRPLSYSQLNTWEYSKDDWYNRYILNIKEPPNAAMLFGSVVGDSIGTPQSLVPTLVPPGVKEYELESQIGDIRIVGYADHYCTDTLVLHENKTSDNLDRWTQAKVDQHKQFDIYALMLFLRDKIKPEDIHMYLNFIPVRVTGAWKYVMPDPPTFIPFETRRTTRDILAYSSYIVETVKEMDAYVAHRLSTVDTPTPSATVI